MHHFRIEGLQMRLATLLTTAVYFFINAPVANAKLSRADVALLDAFAFVMMDFEEGQNPGALTPTKRTVKDNSVEFFQPGQNQNASDNKVYGVWLDESSPEECVFVFNMRMSIPPQMLPKDIQNVPNPATVKYDLNRMTRFEITKFPLNSTVTFFGVRLDGVQVQCENGQCKDKNVMDLSIGYNQLKTPALQAEFATRRERAIDFIKKSCPGKPY
jgi:hypothetical protein